MQIWALRSRLENPPTGRRRCHHYMGDGTLAMEFRFAHPWLLLLLLLLPMLWVWQQSAAPAAGKYAPARFFEHGLKLRRSLVPLAQKFLFYGAAASLLVGLAKPQSGVAREEVRASGIDFMILLDVS